MGTNLKGKTASIIAILVIFVYGIFGIPHGVSGTALKDALLERIHLGLDLKGGTQLVLRCMWRRRWIRRRTATCSGCSGDLAKAGVGAVTVHKLDPVAHPEHHYGQRRSRGQGQRCPRRADGHRLRNYDVTTNADGSRDDDDEDSARCAT